MSWSDRTMLRFWLHTPLPESELPGLIGMSKVPEITGPFARVIDTVLGPNFPSKIRVALSCFIAV